MNRYKFIILFSGDNLYKFVLNAEIQSQAHRYNLEHSLAFGLVQMFDTLPCYLCDNRNTVHALTLSGSEYVRCPRIKKLTGVGVN